MLTRSVRTCRLCGTALQAQRAAATSSFSLLASRRQLAAASPSLVASFHSSRELSRREATGPRGVRKRHPPPSPVHRPHPRSSDVRAPAKPAVEEEELAPTEEQTAIVELKDIPVHVPDDPNGVLDLARGSAAERARQMLAQPALVVVRQASPRAACMCVTRAHLMTDTSPACCFADRDAQFVCRVGAGEQVQDHGARRDRAGLLARGAFGRGATHSHNGVPAVS